MFCGMYVSVLPPQDLTQISGFMAYQVTIVWASQDYARLAWVCYDYTVWREAALTWKMSWSAINLTIYTLCLLRQCRRPPSASTALSSHTWLWSVLSREPDLGV